MTPSSSSSASSSVRTTTPPPPHPSEKSLPSGTQIVQRLSSHVGGKNIVVTGVSPNSIGEASARAIASSRQPPNILILASRTASKLDAVARQLRDEYPALRQPGILHTVLVDLSEADSVRKAAQDILSIIFCHSSPSSSGARKGKGRHNQADASKSRGKLHVLINNAGVNTSSRRYTKDGKVELTFATNHLGPFLLTNLLMPVLLNAAGERNGQGGDGHVDVNRNGRDAVRIVTTSSDAYKMCPIRFDDFNFELSRKQDATLLPVEQRPNVKLIPKWALEGEPGKFPGLLAYGQSKTANILFAVALGRRFRAKGIESFAVHPGLIDTGLTRDISSNFREELGRIPKKMWQSPDQGCAGLMLAAFDPDLSDAKEQYISRCRPTRLEKHACDEGAAEKLWDLSKRLVKGTKTAPTANL